MKITIAILFLLVLTNQSQISDDECPRQRLVTCAQPIVETIEQCSSDNNPKACIDGQLENLPHCLSCVCKLVPDLCIDEQDNTQEEQQRIEYINTVLQEKVATCTAQEIFKCKQHVKHIISQCNRQVACVNQKLEDSTCHICLCTIDPDLCQQEHIVDVSKNRVEEQKQASPFDFLSNVMGMLGGPKKEDKKEEKKQTDVFGMIAQAAQMAQTFGQLFGNKKETKTEAPKQEPKQINSQNPFNMGDALSFLGSKEGSNLMKGFNLSEDDLAQTQTDSFQNTYQSIMEKMMSNPQLLGKLLPLAADPSKISLDSMQDILGDTLFTQTEELPKEGCDDSTYNECKWEVLKILPGCLQQNPRDCLFNLLGQGNKCLGCICKVVPQACRE